LHREVIASILEREETDAMPTLTLDDAQARLREVVAALQPGEEIVLTDGGRALATLIRAE
jgi:antitoxin (DNA-binding transcriptional repressor) of toxin-antitoxin stability system